MRHLHNPPPQRSRNLRLPGFHNTLSRRLASPPPLRCRYSHLHSSLPREPARVHYNCGPAPTMDPPPIVHGLPTRRRTACDRVYLRRPAIMGMIAKLCDLCPLAARDSYWIDPAMASCARIWLRSNGMHLGTHIHSADCAVPYPVPHPRSLRTCITSVAPAVEPREQTAELENESLLRQSRGSRNFGGKPLDQHTDRDRLEMCGHSPRVDTRTVDSSCTRPQGCPLNKKQAYV
ncbi:hypothetical protein HYPSUDRAFT_963266 [Hypholoma sublateritium FD-334 SS-4]|uniref:Uncharacterized protein n=1 Tax=Hypholoma sublateritium (strain FD-334 SS-4) TaxID=945553 RepID=A0A0D2M526_HYPSF|nr:hypothetical protein HYPSUDRAFT_963266 [Hypholoma sublateritium FD-334 SS-4]